MKKSYYIEITLLILLSISAAALAADHNFFALLGLGVGFENTIAIIRVLAFGSVIFFSIWNVFSHIRSPRKLMFYLLASVHNVFFNGVKLNETSGNKMYRVTCYKYYKFDYLLVVFLLILFIFSLSFTFRVILYNTQTLPSILLCVITFFVYVFFFYYLLYIFENWWYQFFRRIFVKGRMLEIGKDYLLSYSRYGFENGVRIKKNTTFPILIDESKNIYRLFAGKIFQSTDDFESSIDNHNINNLLKKMKDYMNVPKAEIEGLKSYLNETVDNNIKALETRNFYKDILTEAEKTEVKKFMQETSTLAWDLFSINDILHSNHFVGFKIKDHKNDQWGVVVIDVLSNDGKDFFNYLKIDPQGQNTKENNNQWLHLVLNSYSEIFSKTINPSINE